MHRATPLLARIIVVSALLYPLAVNAQPVYDLLIVRGHVIDPKNGIDAIRDVAIKDHKIAAVAPKLAPSDAAKVIDAKGLYVTPGLIDIHVHVYAGTGKRNAYCGDLSVYPDGFTFRSGVTTVVDAGTSGWRTFPDFKDRVMDRARTRVLVFLNIVGAGMCGAVEQDVNDMDADATAKMIRQFPDQIVGIKTAHYTGPEWTPVERSVAAGTTASVPVMVDFGNFRPERPYETLVLEKLRPGDISTHMYLGAVPMLDDAGRLRPFLLEARKRGVIFDVGHGGGSFLFRQAVPAITQGFAPDSISTDLHVSSMNAGMKDMLNVMSKVLNMGVSLPNLIAQSTWNPAREIKRESLGNLSPGAPADVTVIRLERGDFGFTDTNGARMKGNRKLICEMTVRDGQVVWDLNGISREDWKELPKGYTAQGDVTWDGTINATVRSRK